MPVKRKPPWGEQRGEEKTFETRPLVQCATATSVSFLFFFFMCVLYLRFSLWHSYLVNAVDTFNNLCLFSCLCTFSSAFVPVGQSLWPFLLLLLPGGNRFCISCLRCCALFSFSFPVFVAVLCLTTQYYYLATFQPQKAISCFLVSFQWNESGSFPFLLYFILVYDLGNFFFLHAGILYGRPEYCNRLVLWWLKQM